jgi:hypothetical protein
MRLNSSQMITSNSICCSFALVIQHLILDGRTTDAIEKTRELFPTLLNDTNLLFVLKVRQFIEMINGTKSEICQKSGSCPLSTSSSTMTDQHSTENDQIRTNCSSSSSLLSTTPTTSKTNSSYAHTTSELTSSSITKTSANSRSNSPYPPLDTVETILSNIQQPINSIHLLSTNSISQQSSTNATNTLSQGRLIFFVGSFFVRTVYFRDEFYTQ